MEAAQRLTLGDLWEHVCSRIELPHKNSITTQWLAVRIQWKRNTLWTVRAKPTAVIRTLLWPRNISKCERVWSAQHGTGWDSEGVLSLLLLEYAIYHFCFLVHGLPSFFKITTKGLSRLHGQRGKPEARDELVLVSIMIKEKDKKVTCRLTVLLLCLRLRLCSQKSTKERVEVMKELLLAIYERQEFPSILWQVQVRGEFLPLCL